MSKLKMNCGYCGRKCDLDKDFCIPQDSVYVCKSCYEWQNRVADLEAKLAEKEDQINWLVEAEFNREWAKKYVEMRRKEDPMLCLPDSDEVYERYFELKQQLEEYKQSLKETIDHYEKYCSEINHQNIMLYASACNAQQASQDKISFAVEQLEKVKEMLRPYLRFDINLYLQTINNIDSQIKQLKENK